MAQFEFIARSQNSHRETRLLGHTHARSIAVRGEMVNIQIKATFKPSFQPGVLFGPLQWMSASINTMLQKGNVHVKTRGAMHLTSQV